MTQNKIPGSLTAALIVCCLSATAQQTLVKKDPQWKKSPHSGLYSAPGGDRRWILNHDAEQAKIDRMQAELDAIQQKVDKEMMNALIGDLIGEKVLAGRDDLQWLALTSDKLIVNGKTASRSLHRKLSRKYIRKAGFGIFYGDPDHKSADNDTPDDNKKI